MVDFKNLVVVEKDFRVYTSWPLSYDSDSPLNSSLAEALVKLLHFVDGIFM